MAGTAEDVEGRRPWAGPAVFVGAIAASIALNAMAIDSAPLSLDEHGSYWAIDSVVPATTYERSLDCTALPPVSYWLQEASIALFGRTEFALRLPSLLCATLAVVALGLFVAHEFSTTKERPGGGWMAAGVAAFVLATHPNVLLQTRFGRCYGLVLLLSVLFIWCSVRWFRSPGDWRRAAIWVAGGTALVWTHYLAGLLVAVSGVAIAVLNLWAADRGDRPRLFLVATAAAGLLAIASLPLLPSLSRLQATSVDLNNGEQTYGLLNVLDWPLLAAIATAAMFSRRGQYGSDASPCRHLYGLLALLAYVPLLMMWLMSADGTGALCSPRYRLPFLPPMAVLFALLVAKTTPLVRTLLTVGVVIVLWVTAPAPPWRVERLVLEADQQWREITVELGELIEPGETVYVQGGLAEGFLISHTLQGDLFNEYVACRLSRFYLPTDNPRVGLPFFWVPESEVPAWYAERLAESRANAETVWVAGSTDTDLNRQSVFGFLSAAARLGYRAELARERTRVSLFRLTPGESSEDAP